MAFDLTQWLTEMGMRAYLNYKTKRRGELVGTDGDGNSYYRDRRSAGTRNERRWVVFKGGETEATRVPPEWHAWLHRQVTNPPAADNPLRRRWQKQHDPNPTGTARAYFPPGHELKGGRRQRATGDYEPWSPP